MPSPGELRAAFGGIDIYLFDQLLRGRIAAGQRILDAGCGGGRNIHYFLREGFEVFGLDPSREAIEDVRALAAMLAPSLPRENFRVERLQDSSFPDGCADVVISSAVLHFAADEAMFTSMLDGSWRLLAPGGLFFCRLASTVGIESQVQPLDAGSRRFHLPDGSDRFLVDVAMLLAETDRLGGRLIDPIKTAVVHGQRSMTTWVLRKL